MQLEGRTYWDWLHDDQPNTITNKSYPKNKRAIKKRAMEAYQEGCLLDENKASFTKAEEAYRRSIELDPTLYGAIINLGHLLIRMKKNTTEAKQLFNRALEIDDTKPEAFYNLACLLHEANHERAAIKNYKLAIECDSSFADAHYNLGNLMYDIGETEEAIPHFQAYIKLDADSTWSHRARNMLSACRRRS